jgi:ferredoxin-nitrite reductase
LLPVCPSLFSPSTAQDGQLARLRIPGGLLSSQQCRVLAEVTAQLGKVAIAVTNRANIQIRGLEGELPAELRSQLQNAGLAAKIAEVDHVRNIMISPTAGIDRSQLLDTRPLLYALDQYLSTHPELSGLSPKFSIGLDGGEQVSIWHQPNDLMFSAVRIDRQPDPGIYLNLRLAGTDATFLLPTKDCVAVVAAIARVYLDVTRTLSRKPRLKKVWQEMGIQEYCDRIHQYLSFPLPFAPSSTALFPSKSTPLDAHPQLQSHLFYLGIALPLGRLEIHQLRSLADLVDTYGSSTLRLTPWRSLLIPDIPSSQLSSLRQELEQLELCSTKHSIWGGMMACSGNTGCAASATNTQADAMTLATAIERNFKLDSPLSIHFSGCPKSCADHGSSDMTLVGGMIEGGLDTDYQLHVGDLSVGDWAHPFGRVLTTNLKPTEISKQIMQILSIYQLRRTYPQQSFREFINQYPIAQLRHWLDQQQQLKENYE